MKIAIISHTEHYLDEEQKIVGWGSTVKEINYFSDVVTNVTHIAPLHKEKAPKSALPYTKSNINFVALKPSGGKGIEKLLVLLKAPYNIYKIYQGLKGIDYIQFRAPTGMGVYVLPFLTLFYSKKFWVKYAGNWKDIHMPLANKLQKKWLQKIIRTTTKVTVNGSWKGEKSNILPFENPCLTKKDRVEGKKAIENKRLEEKIHFCFVGALNKHKGVDKILKAFQKIESNKIGSINFVGDGIDRKEFEELAQKVSYKVIFHGYLPKDKINEVYKKSHYLLLPSKSEGFPKVVGEAMNFGCVPIVSDVSCIADYIKNNKNGYLVFPITTNELIRTVKKALLNHHKDKFIEKIMHNYGIANKFTYQYYNKRIKEDILNFN